MADTKVKSIKIGKNIRAKMVGDDLILRINLAQEGEPSKSGKAVLLAQSGGFASLNEVTGQELALNLLVAKRKEHKKAAAKGKAKPAAKPAKAPAKPVKVKRRAKRDDDED
jgi:hypothetical protein